MIFAYDSCFDHNDKFYILSYKLLYILILNDTYNMTIGLTYFALQSNSNLHINRIMCQYIFVKKIKLHIPFSYVFEVAIRIW